MEEAIQNHTVSCLADLDSIAGFAVAIVGTKRSAYVVAAEHPEQPDYNEEAALVLDRTAASQLMSSLYDTDRNLWKFARLVPVSKKDGLPTVNGY